MNLILVTPGTIGDHVATQLQSKGHRVRVLVREVLKDAPWNALGIEQVAGDLRSIESLAPAFQGVEKFLSVSPFVEDLAQLGLNSIEAAKRAGVKHIVRASAMGAASDSPITAPRLHAQVEETLAGSGISYTVLRPNAFMQNYLGLAAGIKSQGAFYLPQGDSKISAVDARDIAAMAVCTLTEPGHAGKTYTVTGPEAISNQEVAEKMSTQLGRKITYVNVTDEQAADSMRASGMDAWSVGVMIELMQAARAGYMAATSPDARNILKRPPASFDQFLKDHLQVFHGAAAAG